MKQNRLLFFFLILFLAFLYVVEGCSDSDVAGGVSEETNTIAGVLFDKKSSPVVGALVYLQNVNIDTLTSVDTTDSKGKFELSVSKKGTYGVYATMDSFAYYELIEFGGKNVELNAQLLDMGSITGNVFLREDSAVAGVEVSVLGTSWKAKTDSLGNFVINEIPQKNIELLIKPFDLTRFVRVYKKIAVNKTTKIDSIIIPLHPEYGQRIYINGAVSTSENIIKDSRGFSSGLKLYESPKVDYMKFENSEISGIVLDGASQFGVIENDYGVLNNVSAFSVEVTLQIDSLMGRDSVYRKNLVGKLGFGNVEDKDVFSLAIINGMCGVDKPSFAAFIADGSGDTLSCSNAVIDTNELELKKIYNLIFSWNKSNVTLFVNGKKSTTGKTSFEKIYPSEESIYIGKEFLKWHFFELKIYDEPLNEYDVEYRYNMHFTSDSLSGISAL